MSDFKNPSMVSGMTAPGERRRVGFLQVFPCVVLFVSLLSSCTGASGQSGRVDVTSTTLSPEESLALLAPIDVPDRAPNPPRLNKANDMPPAPAPGVFEEFDKIRAEYVIPSDPGLAATNTRNAALAFGGSLRSALENPEPSASNMRVPGYDGVVSFPASINSLGRAAMYQRLGVTGVDVGPSKPDVNGMVWVAIFQGASGPIGGVVSSCQAVVVFARYDSVHLKVVEVPSSLDKQPASVTDWPLVLCDLDLLNPPSEDYIYKH